MENQVSQVSEFRKYYLSEFELYDGEAFITFNIVHIDTAKREIQVAVTNRGRISVITYDLLTGKDGKMYFEYGCTFEKVHVDNFEQIDEEICDGNCTECDNELCENAKCTENP